MLENGYSLLIAIFPLPPQPEILELTPINPHPDASTQTEQSQPSSDGQNQTHVNMPQAGPATTGQVKAIAGIPLHSSPNSVVRDTAAQSRKVLLLADVVEAPIQSNPSAFSCINVAAPGIMALSEALLHTPGHLCSAIPMPDLMEQAISQQLFELQQDALVSEAPVAQINIYPDGSSLFNVKQSQKVAAWSFVVIACRTDGTQGKRSRLTDGRCIAQQL